jgi:hypothetical protein
MQGVLVFANATARDAAITSPQEGQFAFTKDNDSLWYYSGSAWVSSGATGDIEGVSAGVGISGGGTSGTVTVTNSMATAIDAKGDLIAGTGADTFARLAVGANDTVLTADSTAATGLKWASPAGGSSFAGVSAYKSAVQSINNSTWSALTFDTENFDTNTFHDNSTNNTRLTIPSGKGGYYSIGGNIVFAGNATGIRAVGIYKNGSAFVYVSGIPGGVASDIRANFAYVMSLTAGDYVEVYALQTSGGALNIMPNQSDTTFSAYLIGV